MGYSEKVKAVKHANGERDKKIRITGRDNGENWERTWGNTMRVHRRSGDGRRASKRDEESP